MEKEKEPHFDGYIENEKDIFDGFYKFQQEETRVLYPFVKVRSGGTNEFPQYYYRMFPVNT